MNFWLAVAALAGFFGLCWISLSMLNHWAQVFPLDKRKPHPARLRSLGALMVLISVISCFRADHPSMAILVWVTMMPVASLAVALLLSYRPAFLRFLALPFLSQT